MEAADRAAAASAIVTAMANVTIRPATLADVDAIVAMQRLIHGEHVAGDPLRWTTTTSPHAVYPAWLGELIGGRAAGVVLVAADGAAIVGYLIAEVEDESTKHWSPAAVYFHDLFVAPGHRRGGVARRLVEALRAWRDAHRPALPVRLITASSNEAARAFFARHGFRAATVEMIEDVQAARSSAR